MKMERCAYCGGPIRGDGIEFGDEVFCSEDCMDQFETAEDDRDDDIYSDRDYGDDSLYQDY